MISDGLSEYFHPVGYVICHLSCASRKQQIVDGCILDQQRIGPIDSGSTCVSKNKLSYVDCGAGELEARKVIPSQQRVTNHAKHPPKGHSPFLQPVSGHHLTPDPGQLLVSLGSGQQPAAGVQQPLVHAWSNLVHLPEGGGRTLRGDHGHSYLGRDGIRQVSKTRRAGLFLKLQYY